MTSQSECSVTCFEVKEYAFSPECIYAIYIFTLTAIIIINIVHIALLAREVFSKFASACSTECCPLLSLHLVGYNLYFVITIYVVTLHKVQRSGAFSLCRQISILKRHSAIAVRPPKFTRYKMLENYSFEITRLLLHISVNSKGYKKVFLCFKE
jgi:hypothetical protein